MNAGPVRPSPIAGSWYPGDGAGHPRRGRALPGGRSATRRCAGRLVGLIAPHAGLRYSGPVAAHAYATLRGRARLVAVLVGPSHRAAFDGVAVYARGAFETPLGRAVVDEAVAARTPGRRRRRRGRRAAASPRALASRCSCRSSSTSFPTCASSRC